VRDLRFELAERIRRRLKTRQYCTVFDHDLSAVSVPPVKPREMQFRDIERFAAQNGYGVTIRDAGLSATFKKLAA